MIEAQAAFIEKMDEDLSRFTDFDQLSARVSHWNRRFAFRGASDELVEQFNSVVSRHSIRVLGVMRAG